MHARAVLGVGKGVRLEKYPQFRSVLIKRERFHCTYTYTHLLCEIVSFCVCFRCG